MSKIRKDFEGVTIVRDSSGRDVMLKAGDKIPEGVTVGSHLLSAKTDPAPPPPAPTSTPTPAVVPTPTPVTTVVPEPTPPVVSEPTLPPKAGAGSSADAWRAYAVAETAKRGLSVEIPEGASRGDIIEALEGAQIPTE